MKYLIILFPLGILGVLILLCIPKNTRFYNGIAYLLLLIFAFAMSITGFISIIKYKYHSCPTDKDVLSGKAEYIETVHISKGDTIKTYKREWRNE